MANYNKAFIVYIIFPFYLVSNSNWEIKFNKLLRQKNSPHWMQKQIDNDLHQFKNKIKLDAKALPGDSLDHGKNSIGGHYFLRIEIKNNHIIFDKNKNFKEVLSENDGSAHHERKNVIAKALTDLIAVTNLPDIVFFLDITDGFAPHHENPKYDFPIFAFSKNKDRKGILLFPDPHNLSGRVSECKSDPGYKQVIIPETKEASRKYPWEAKIEKLVWRGSNADIFTPKGKESPRAKLLKLSDKSSMIIDAGITLIWGGEDAQEAFSRYQKPRLSLQEHIQYKYQILLDGATSSWSRAHWQLLSNSVVFKQDSDNIQWYYGALKPFKHYIPVKNELDDLENQILWAKKHDKKAQKIAKTATEFAEKQLDYASSLFYIYLLLNKYAELFNCKKFTLIQNEK